jgi:hypothetical protein
MDTNHCHIHATLNQGNIAGFTESSRGAINASYRDSTYCSFYHFKRFDFLEVLLMSSITCSACSAGVGLGVAERTLDIHGYVYCPKCAITNIFLNDFWNLCDAVMEVE